MEQLFRTLRKNNIIESVRGSQGGYMLSKKPKDITVGDVLRTLEGDLSPTECTNHEDYNCSQLESCVTKDIWVRIKIV